MAGNTALDFVIGAVPLLGDVFDATFTANLRNIVLMRQDLFVTVRYARRARYREGAATRGTRRQVTPMRNRAGSRPARATLDRRALLARLRPYARSRSVICFHCPAMRPSSGRKLALYDIFWLSRIQ